MLSHLYGNEYALEGKDGLFPDAQAFFGEVIKIPVYATADGQAATERYVKTILKIAAEWIAK